MIEITTLQNKNYSTFNSDENKVTHSRKISFYKGIPVFLHDEGRSFSFYVIGLNRNEKNDTLKHESGHNVQANLMNPLFYLLMIGLPSKYEWSDRDYYDRLWEVSADHFGGVEGRSHNKSDINRGLLYLGTSALFGPVGYLFLVGEQ